MSCGCGRSPSGECIGWHSLSEEDYQKKLEEYNKSKNGQPENGHSTEVAVSFLIDGQIAESDSSKALKIAIDGDNYRKLRRHPALAGLRIEAVPPAPVDNRPPWEKRRAS